MKIVQIGPYPLSNHIVKGGVEASVQGLSIALAKNHDVYVIDYPRLESNDVIEKNNGLEIYRVYNPGKHVVDSARRIPDILLIIQSLAADVCHIHGTSVFSWKLYRKLKQARIPVVITVHGLAHVEKKNTLFRSFKLKTVYQFFVQSFFERRIVHGAPYLIADTEYVAEMITRHYRKSKGQISVIPQGINDRFYQMSCSESSTEILSVGAFSARKGHIFLIKAFEEMMRKGVEAHLTICGTVNEPVYFNELEQYLNDSPYRNRFTLRRDISQDELFTMYQEAHLFALHSQEESQGIALVEAMSIGLPVVATLVGGIPYVVHDKETGLLSEYGDVSSFSKSLAVLMTDFEMWKAISENGRKDAVHYSWPHIAALVERVYDSAINWRTVL